MPDNHPHPRFTDAIKGLFAAAKQIGLLEFITIIVLALPIIDGVTSFADAPQKTWAIWVKLVLYTVLAILSMGTVIIQKRNSINAISGKAAGTIEYLKRWDINSGLLETAINSAGRYFNKRLNSKDKTFGAAEESINNALMGIDNIFGVLFKETCGRIHVSLGVPKADESAFKIVKMYPEAGGRSAESIYPRDTNEETAQTMSLAFLKPEHKCLLYQPNSRLQPGMESKNYQTIVNITIYGPKVSPPTLAQQPATNVNRVAIAVLNIDSTNQDAFPDPERLQLAHSLSMPYLRLIALILTDSRVFNEYRCATPEA